MIISVIMLTCNRENFIGKAIESILSQTFTDFDFIVVDNGSDDRSGAIADEYAAKDRRINVIHCGRGNIGSGRNRGLDAASGEYIAFIDDDDWAEPDFLEFLYNLARDSDAEVSICGATDKAFSEKMIMSAEESIVNLLWRKYYNVQFPTKLIKRGLFKGLRFSESSKYDDIELMPRVLAKARRVAYHGLPKYTFYRHEGNNSAWTTNHSLLTSETLDEYLRVYRERTDWLCGRFPERSDMWKYFEWSFMLSMVEKINRLELKSCGRQLQDMTGELRKHRGIFLRSEYLLDKEKKWLEEYI